MDVIKVEPLTTARALRGPFDYRRAGGMESVGVGSILEVPFGRQRLRAVVTGLAASSEHRLAEPLRVLPDSVPAELVELALWMADEYVSTPARALGLVLPPPGRAKTALWAERLDGADAKVTERQAALLDSLPRWTGKDTAALRRLEARGLVSVGPRGRRRAVTHHLVGERARPQLTDDQARAVEEILQGGRTLLHGVTGSGKTEVYLQLAERVDGGVIVLVPEIALTPQVVARFVERFGDTVAVLHSKLSAGERYDEWRRLRSGEARICVGPRSAVFAPLERPALVIVDEEHDPSYKHEGDPRYDARLVAERRAREGLLVCGSATPRCESVQRLRRVRLPTRVDGRPLPPVEVIDMRATNGTLHPRTHEALVDARKAIVLLNRRGWSNFLTCRTCGHAFACPQCDVTLVLHRSEATLACHHCGHREPVPRACPSCGGISIARHGAGTERLERELYGVGGEVFRLDADVQHAGAVLAAFLAADRGVLLGTQVVAKGHDFPDVELGVVLDADGTLRFPDFRAEERTFALVTQLAGRAGRGTNGRVLVQTIAPDAPAIRLAARHDSDTFTAEELRRREALAYPPFATLIRIVAASEQPGAAHAAAAAIRSGLGPGALGPAPLFRLRGRERSQVVVKARERQEGIGEVRAAVAAVAADRAHRAASLSVDVDPQ
jgi:primosomal protein N' (replication factor Y) (superfamily II helicase)